MSIAVMDVRSGARATLLALTVLWVGTSLPHMYSSARTFFLESLPALVSAAMAPRCLFVFSNIIIIFLVGESKLSRRRAALRNTTAVGSADNGMLLPERKEEEVMAVVTEALLPPTSFAGGGASTQEQGNNVLMVIHEDRSSSVLNQGIILRSTKCRRSESRSEDVDHHFYDDRHEVYEVQIEMEQGEFMGGQELRREKEYQDGAAMMQESPETDLPPADELNRRVEDFIARFNMERQLEAKMLVCCY